MVDPRVLKIHGSTQERLKQILTAEAPSDYDQKTDDEKKAIDRDVCLRKKLEDQIQFRLWESLTFNLKNYQLYSAVDVAWDSTPINKAAYPLTLYAQGKLDMGACATSLTNAGFGKYVTKDAKGAPIDINLPKFYETQVDLIRSILTRRLAAQSNKYSNLYPFYKYESRSTSQVGKLRADVMSQRADIIADQFGYRHHEVQVMRDVLMYNNIVDFIRSSWEKEEQEYIKAQAPGLETGTEQPEKKITKEGLCFVNPHPSRVFWDNRHPLPSLNDDIGCEYVGYWDVWRYRDVNENTKFWNRDKISYSNNIIGLFGTYGNYFSQYYCTINAPTCNNSPDLSAANDRSNNIGLYTTTQGDTSIIVANYFAKIIPNEWGIGTYPYPVWCQFIVASDRTIQFADFLPSTPGAVASHNSNDNRQVNISLAMELMGYQDQLTNLISYLLLCLQSDNIRVMVVDTDVATPEQIKAFREQLKGSGAYTGTTILEISRSKLQELEISPDKVVNLVETRASQLDVIFRAIGQLINLVERMAALSPQEQGQPAPREISATETNLIAGTTESVYGFVSDSIDEYRAAKKRILYESLMAFGDDEIRCPVISRYPRHIIEKAGFRAEDGEMEEATGVASTVDRYTVIGTKRNLLHDYIFTSRDGAERPVNSQSANTLVQLLNSMLSNPAIANGMNKEQLYDIVNEIFRMSGTGVDLNLEAPPGEESKPLGPDPGQELIQQIEQMLEGLTKAVEENKTETANIKSIIEPVVQGLQQRGLLSMPQQMPEQAMSPAAAA